MNYYRDTAYEEWSQRQVAIEGYALCECGELVEFDDSQPTWCPTCRDECLVAVPVDEDAIWRAIVRRRDEQAADAAIDAAEWRDDIDF